MRIPRGVTPGALASKPVATVESRFGPIRAYAEDEVTRQIARFGNHTRPDFAFATAVLAPEARVFDLGAHIGTFALTALARLSPRGRLLAVEGSAGTHRILARNLTRRGGGAAARIADVLRLRPRATTCHALVAGGPGDWALHEDGANTGATRLVSADAADPGARRAVTLDDLVARHFAPDFVKLDTEGTEAAILTGSDYVREARPILYLEVNADALARFGATPAALDAHLRSLDYAYYVNDFDRNGAHDLFRPRRCLRLADLGALGDVLCIPRDREMRKVLNRLAPHPARTTARTDAEAAP